MTRLIRQLYHFGKTIYDEIILFSLYLKENDKFEVSELRFKAMYYFQPKIRKVLYSGNEKEAIKKYKEVTKCILK